MPVIKPSHVGLLHKATGIPMGKKIPIAALMIAKKSPSLAKRKQAQFDLNMNH